MGCVTLLMSESNTPEGRAGLDRHGSKGVTLEPCIYWY
jgi:hypothetical protein